MLDATGRIRAQFTIGHTAAGFADLLRRLARLTGDPAEVAVGIERPDGRLVDVLLEAGYPVIPVSPNAIKTWRDGEVLSGAKSDAGDARGDRRIPAAAGAPGCSRPTRTPRKPRRCAPWSAPGRDIVRG